MRMSLAWERSFVVKQNQILKMPWDSIKPPGLEWASRYSIHVSAYPYPFTDLLVIARGHPMPLRDEPEFREVAKG